MFYILGYILLTLEAVTMVVMLMWYISRREEMRQGLGPVLYTSTCIMLLIAPFFLAGVAHRSWNLIS